MFEMLAHEHELGSETLSPFIDSRIDKRSTADQSRLHQSLLEFINIPEL